MGRSRSIYPAPSVASWQNSTEPQLPPVLLVWIGETTARLDSSEDRHDRTEADLRILGQRIADVRKSSEDLTGWRSISKRDLFPWVWFGAVIVAIAAQKWDAVGMLVGGYGR